VIQIIWIVSFIGFLSSFICCAPPPCHANREKAFLEFLELCHIQLINCDETPKMIFARNEYDLNCDGIPDNTTLLELCNLKGIKNESECKRTCGCP
jgi:hypothetical protein